MMSFKLKLILTIFIIIFATYIIYFLLQFLNILPKSNEHFEEDVEDESSNDGNKSTIVENKNMIDDIYETLTTVLEKRPFEQVAEKKSEIFTTLIKESYENLVKSSDKEQVIKKVIRDNYALKKEKSDKTEKVDIEKYQNTQKEETLVSQLNNIQSFIDSGHMNLSKATDAINKLLTITSITGDPMENDNEEDIEEDNKQETTKKTVIEGFENNKRNMLYASF